MSVDPFNCPKCGRHDYGLRGYCPSCDKTPSEMSAEKPEVWSRPPIILGEKPEGATDAVPVVDIVPRAERIAKLYEEINDEGTFTTLIYLVREQAATIAALREEVSRLTDNQRQQDSATAFVMERDEKERDALRKEVEEYKSEYFRVHNLKMDAIEARLAAERELAALRREVEELKPFKDAIDDQMIVLHLGTADTYRAKQCLDEIINWQVSISLDPQVSSDAAALRDTHLERAEAAERELAAAQAKIDSLMLEYCPEEMTKEQLENWGRHQTPVEEINEQR